MRAKPQRAVVGQPCWPHPILHVCLMLLLFLPQPASAVRIVFGDAGNITQSEERQDEERAGQHGHVRAPRCDRSQPLPKPRIPLVRMTALGSAGEVSSEESPHLRDGPEKRGAGVHIHC